MDVFTILVIGYTFQEASSVEVLPRVQKTPTLSRIGRVLWLWTIGLFHSLGTRCGTPCLMYKTKASPLTGGMTICGWTNTMITPVCTLCADSVPKVPNARMGPEQLPRPSHKLLEFLDMLPIERVALELPVHVRDIIA